MEPPIIVDDSGDVLIFASVEKAESYLELIDVKQSKIPIYDSQGRLLSASIVPRKRKVAFFYDLMVECVLIESMEPEPQHQPELRKLLLTFLSGAPHRLEGLEKMSLIQLVQMGLKGCGGHSRAQGTGRKVPANPTAEIHASPPVIGPSGTTAPRPGWSGSSFEPA